MAADTALPRLTPFPTAPEQVLRPRTVSSGRSDYSERLSREIAREAGHTRSKPRPVSSPDPETADPRSRASDGVTDEAEASTGDRETGASTTERAAVPTG